MRSSRRRIPALHTALHTRSVFTRYVYCFTRCVTYVYMQWLPSYDAACAALLLSHAVSLTFFLLTVLLTCASFHSVLLAALLPAMLMLLVGCKLLPG